MTEWSADHPLASLYGLTFQRLERPALESGVISRSDFDRLSSMLREPGFHALSHIVYAGRGQRPARGDQK